MARFALRPAIAGSFRSAWGRRQTVGRRSRRVSWGEFAPALEDRTLLATDVWTGAVSSSWSAGGNWSLGAPPGTSDIASFTNSGTGASLLAATLDGPQSIAGLSIDNTWNGVLTLEDSLALSGSSQILGGTIDFSQRTGTSGTIPGSLSNGGALMYGGTAALQWDAADDLTNGGTLTISSGGTFLLAAGAALDNTGMIIDQAGGAGFQIGANSTLANESGGTFDFQGDGSVVESGSAGTFSNNGILEKTLGAGTSAIGVDFSNENGNISVSTGTISLAAAGGTSAGGHFTVASGAFLNLTGGQSVTYSGSFTGSGSGAIALSGGTLAIGTGGASFNFSGPLFQWSGGTIDTTLGGLTNLGTINLTGASGEAVHLTGNRAVTNVGTIVQSGAATLDLDAPVTLANEPSGVYNFATDATISEDGQGGTFLNSGVLEKTGGTGTSQIDQGISFHGTGTVSVGSGTLNIANTGAIITAGSLSGGTWVIAGGSTLSLQGNIATLGATVMLEGQGASFPALDSLSSIASTGVLELTNGASLATLGNLDNAGTLDLGPGSLTVAGNFTQESGATLDESVTGTTPGTQFGQLTVHGKATLAGTLAATVTSGFTPVLGQSLPIIPFGSLSGQFGATTGLALTGPVSLAPSYGTTSVALAAVKSTAATLTSSANPISGTGTLTFTIKIQPVPPQTGVPTGTVTFLDGTTKLGTATLSNGQATFSPSSPLSLGIHSITAAYAGDAGFGASTSNALSQSVEDATNTTVVPSVNPAAYSQPLSLTVTVSSMVSGAGTPTGIVTFMDETTTLGTAALANGTAIFPVPANLSTATHTITAVYGGDNRFVTSTSPALSEVVKQDGSITTIKSSTNPSTFGGSTTLSATVTSDHLGNATPTGAVTFKNGSVVLGTIGLSSGAASLSISTLPGGSDSITAVYNGDVNFATSTSAAVSQTVNTQGTTTVLSTSGLPIVFGESATYNVSVKPDVAGSGTPTGSVILSIDTGSGRKLLTNYPLSNGQASIPFSLMGFGAVNLDATYSGDGNFAASVSQEVSQTVVPDATTTVVSSSGSPQAPGVSAILTATVSAQAPGSGTPTGLVTFKDGSTVLGTKTLSGGTAQLTTPLAAGSNSITVVYGGDTNFITSTSPAIGVLVQQVGSHTSLATSTGGAVYGQGVTFTATVTPASGAGTPAGSVTFMSGSTALGTVALAGGTAVFTTSLLPLGTTTLSATYGGSGSFTTSASASVTTTIVAVGTFTTLAPSANPGFLKQFVTLTATVHSDSPGTLAPSGIVTFKLGKKKLGTENLVNGTAAIKTKKLAMGSNKITVVYSGNVDFDASTSATLREVIKKKPPAKKPKKK